MGRLQESDPVVMSERFHCDLTQPGKFADFEHAICLRLIDWLKAFEDHFTTLCKTRVKEELTEIVHRVSMHLPCFGRDRPPNTALSELSPRLPILKPNPTQSTFRRVTRFVLQTTL